MPRTRSTPQVQKPVNPKPKTKPRRTARKVYIMKAKITTDQTMAEGSHFSNMIHKQTNQQFEKDPIVNPAVSKVLNTVELLESILLKLPCRDVLLAQRVSKTWQDTITGSLMLQKALFFVPPQQPDVIRFPTTQSTNKDINKYMHMRCTPLKHKPNLSAQDVIDAIAQGKLVLNPLFTKLFPHHESHFPFLYDRTNTVADPAPASWRRRMYMTQPPLEGIMLRSKNKLPSYSRDTTSLRLGDVDDQPAQYTNTVNEESGVTMARFVEHLELTFEHVVGNKLRFDVFML